MTKDVLKESNSYEPILYDLEGGEMREANHGRWVLHADYLNLRNRLSDSSDAKDAERYRKFRRATLIEMAAAGEDPGCTVADWEMEVALAETPEAIDAAIDALPAAQEAK